MRKKKKVVNNELELLKIANYERIIFFSFVAKEFFIEEIAYFISLIEKKSQIDKDLLSNEYNTFAPEFDRLYSYYKAISISYDPNINKLQEMKEEKEKIRKEIIELLARSSINKTFTRKIVDKIELLQIPLPIVVIKCLRTIEDIKKRLIEDNRYLIVNIARDRHKVKDRLEEVVNSGIQGLVKAINLFEPIRGYKFSTYAYRWIDVFVREAILSESGDIKIPIYLQKKMRRASKYYTLFVEQYRREPTLEELSFHSGVKESELREIERVKEMQISSIQKPIGEKNTVEDVLTDNRQDERLIEFVHIGLNSLNGIEANILIDIYGLNGKPILNSKEICLKYKLSTRNFNKIKKSAIESFRRTLS